jgi:hypothetical protein
VVGATIGKTIFTCVYIEKKIFRASRPISSKLISTNHPWIKEILNRTNKVEVLQSGNNHKNAKI